MSRRPLTATLLAAAGVLLVAACSASPTAAGPSDGTTAGTAAGEQELYPLTVTSQPLSHVVPLILGQEQGFFADHGIDLRLDTSNADAVSVPTVLSGQVAISNADLTTLLAASSRGLGVTAVVPASASTGVAGADYGALVVPAGSAVTRASELEGKVVSSNSLTNIAAAAAREAVAADGGDPDAIELVEVPFPDVPAALSSGSVDAAWVVEPFLTAALSQGATAVGWGFTDLAEDLTVSAWYTSQEFAAAEPEVVEGFRAAVRESYAYARDHEDEVRATIPEFTSIPAEVAAKITITGWQDDISESALTKLTGYAKRDGLITDDPDLDTFVLP